MRKKAIFLLSIVLFVMSWAGCGEKEKPQKIDMRRKLAVSTKNEAKDALFFGVSSSESPQNVYRRYIPMVGYLEKMTGYKVKLVQRRTYNELNELLKKRIIDFAWLAAGAYVSLNKNLDFEILALPSKDEKSYYQACIIVHKDSPINNFNELSGKSFAFVDPLSHSGYYYPAYLLSKRKLDADKFFSQTIFSGNHDKSIGLILNKDVDGASVSSFILYSAQEKSSKIKKNIKVIQKSALFIMGPIVVKKEMPIELKEQLKEIMFNMHLDEEGKKSLKTMAIDRFIQGNDSDYNPIREIIKAVGELSRDILPD